MKIQSIRLFGAVLAVYLSASCAAMFTGTTNPVSFQSVPDGATVSLNDEVLGTTPFVFDLKKKTKEVVIHHPDFGERVVPIDRRTRWGFVVMDILFTPGYGLVGLIIDGATGAWHKSPAMVKYDFNEPVPPDEGAPSRVTATP